MKIIRGIIAVEDITSGRVVQVYHDTLEAKEVSTIMEERPITIGTAVISFKVGDKIAGVLTNDGMFFWPEAAVCDVE